MCSTSDSKDSSGENRQDSAVKSVDTIEDPKKDKKNAEKVPFSELFSFLETPKSKMLFAIGIFFAILNGCVYPILAFIFSTSFSDLAAMSTPRVVKTALTFLGIGSYAFVASCGQNICFEYVSKSACKTFRLRWFSALLRQDSAFFDINDVSGFASSIEPNAQTVKRGLGKKFGEGIQFMVTSIGGIIFALTMSWRVALLVLSILPLVSASALAVMKINQSQTESQSKAYAKAGSVAYQTVSSIRTVFALNAVPEMIKLYAEATQDAYNKAVRPLIKIGLVNGSMLGSFICLYCILTLYGVSLLFRDVRKSGCDPSKSMSGNIVCGSTGVEVFGAMLGIAFAAQGMSQVANFIEAVSAARAACFPAMQAIKRTVGSDLGQQREVAMAKKPSSDKEKKAVIKRRSTLSFFRRSSVAKDIETIDEPNQDVDEEAGTRETKALLPKYEIDSSSDTGTKLPITNGSVQFKDVVFAYPTRPNNPVYNLFSLDIPADSTVALVGPSGGGKTTAISLLERFYDPSSGEISIDGQNIRTMNVHHLRDQIGLVNQEPTLFATSIAGNIAYGCPGATSEQIEAAARLSNAHDFIMSFPDGYNTQVGDKGTQLSGGQKQRIAIARVLVKNPKILLLDEATSALDSESELVVQEALDQLLEGGKRTTIVVAHRLTTIRKADKIAYVANGRVLEYGSHDELMTSSTGHYRALVEKQFGGNLRASESSSMLVVEGSEQVNALGSSISASNIKSDAVENTASGKSDVLKAMINFSNVTFAYPTRPSKRIFDDFSLSINRGETLALVGPSGGGKSTTVALMERFYDPDSGLVEFDGVDMKTLNVHWLRDQIGYVGQEPVLFNNTIAKNIAYGFAGASRADIEKAAKLANAHEFIMSFPSGYDTPVGERGTQLSGGQKQRIAIARALVKNPRVLILDEATSALDSHSEAVVQSALDELLLSTERTTVIIAHRLSTIRNASKIAFIGNGRVLEIGTHDELMNINRGRYRRLVDTQMRGSQLDLATLRELMYGNKSKDKDDGDVLNASVVEVSKQDEVSKKYAMKARSMALQDWKSILVGSIGAIFAGGVFPAWGVMFALLIDLLFTRVEPCSSSNIPTGFQSCRAYWDSTADDMKMRSYELAGYWALIVAGCFIGYALVFFGFGTASEGLNKRIRDMAFTALCRQEVAYFDKRSVGSITSQLQDDAAKIHAFSGQPIRIFLINLSSVIAGVIISFVYMWPFALVALGVIPIMGFATSMEMKTYLGEDIGKKGSDIGKDTPGGVAIETLLNIRTVSALNMEKSRYDDYVKTIEKKEDCSLWSSVKVGSLSGFSILVQQYVNALEFWWGGWLLIHYPQYFTFENFLVSMFSLLFALFALGASSIGAVEKKQMQDAAQRIFELINRKSTIDSLSNDGKKLS